MAAVVTIDRTNVVGNQREVQGTIALDNAYATNGYAVSAADLGLSQIFQLHVNPSKGFVFDYVSGKVVAFYADYSSSSDGALIEVANEGDASAVTAASFTARGI